MFAEVVLAKAGLKSNPGSGVEKVFFIFKLKAILYSDSLVSTQCSFSVLEIPSSMPRSI